MTVGQTQRAAPVDVDVILGAVLAAGTGTARHHHRQPHHLLTDQAEQLSWGGHTVFQIEVSSLERATQYNTAVLLLLS